MEKTNLYYCFLPGLFLLAQVHSRAVNISSSWTLPQEGFPHFFRYFNGLYTWDEAKAICKSLQGELLTVETNERRDAARAYLKELDVLSNVWCGLQRSSIEAPFVWTGGGKGPVVGDGFWQEANTLEPEKLCVAINPLYDYRWQSFPCSGPTAYSFVCQLPVPDWAKGEDGCLLNSLPSLTVTYLQEIGVIELMSDCGLAGTKRIACKGGEKQADLIKRLSCEEDFRISTQGWTERGQHSHHSDTSTTSDWATHITRTWGTRHKRESGGTTAPTSTTHLPEPEEEEVTQTSTTPQPRRETTISRLIKKEPVAEVTVEVTGPTTTVATTSEQAELTSELTALHIEIKTEANPIIQSVVIEKASTFAPSTAKAEEVTASTPVHELDLNDNEGSNEIPVIALEASETLLSNPIVQITPVKADNAFFINDLATPSTATSAPSTTVEDKSTTTVEPVKIAVAEIIEEPSTIKSIEVTEVLTQKVTPQREAKIERTVLPIESFEEIATPEIKIEKINAQEDVIILDEVSQEKSPSRRRLLPLTVQDDQTEAPVDITFSAVDNDTNNNGSDPERQQLERPEQPAVEIIARVAGEVQTTETPKEPDTIIPVIVIAELTDEETDKSEEQQRIEIVEQETTTERYSSTEVSATSQAIKETTSTEDSTTYHADVKETVQNRNTVQETGRPDIVTLNPMLSNSEELLKLNETKIEEIKEVTSSLTSSTTPEELKDTTSYVTTKIPMADESSPDSDSLQEAAVEEPSSDEIDNPKRPKRGRLFPHSNPLSFYPYFLNRVLG